MDVMEKPLGSRSLRIIHEKIKSSWPWWRLALRSYSHIYIGEFLILCQPLNSPSIVCFLGPLPLEFTRSLENVCIRLSI